MSYDHYRQIAVDCESDGYVHGSMKMMREPSRKGGMILCDRKNKNNIRGILVINNDDEVSIVTETQTLKTKDINDIMTSNDKQPCFLTDMCVLAKFIESHLYAIKSIGYGNDSGSINKLIDDVKKNPQLVSQIKDKVRFAPFYQMGLLK